MKSSKSFLLLFLLFAMCTTEKKESGYIVLKGATIYDGNGNRYPNGVVVIDSGKIVSVGGEDIPVPDGAEVKDVSGKFITPGLIDAHVHFFQTGFFDARPDALDLRDSLPYSETYEYQKDHPERYYEAYLRSGVTAVYDVGGFDWSVAFQQSAENNPDAPHVAAAGRLITPAPEERIAIFNLPDDPVMVHLLSEEIGRQTVDHNTSLGSTGIKIWGMTANDTSFMRMMNAIADEINELGNKLIVHATNLEGAKAALMLGARMLVHSVEDQGVDDEFIRMAKENETVLTPTLVVVGGYYNTYKAVLGEGFHINDPNNVVDVKTRDLLKRAHDFAGLVDTAQLRQRLEGMARSLARRDSVMALNLRKLFDAGVLLAVGTDAGNPGTLHGISIYDEMEKMQAFGIPAGQLIVMATKNGALAMDRQDDLGTLEPGKKADLILLDKDPGKDISNMRSITHFMREGELQSVKDSF